MKIAKEAFALLLILCVAGIAGDHAAANDATAKLSRQWGTRDIQADVNTLASVQVAPLSNDSPFVIGLVNDRDFRYVLLRTSDAPMRARMMREGLVVWFDPKGGTKKVFGIQYPSGRRPDPGDPLSTLDVLGPGKEDRLRQVVAKTEDPKVHISSAEGTVTYQIEISLAANGEYYYAIGSAPGSVIGIGLTTPDATEGSGRSAIGGGRPGGGGRGGGGRGGGGGRRGGGGYGGGQGRGEGEQLKPLKEWTTVKLAAGPGA